MGVQPFLITATVEAILAQRLVRRICNNCRDETRPSAEMLAELQLTPEDVRRQEVLPRQRLRSVQQHRLQGPRRACSS